MREFFYNFFRKEKIVFLLVLSLLLADRFLLLLSFNFEYVTNDELILWQAANDYSKGVFHEPYFYGQNYNLLLEAFLAIPFIWLDMPFNYALPLTTACISLFPFLLFATVLFKRGYVAESLVFLVIPLTLPFEYSITSSMPRGFVQGLFFSGFFVFPLLDPHKKSSWFVSALALGLGYIANPNSIIVAGPVCLYLLLNNYKRFLFYWNSLVTIVPILIVEFLAKKFYEIHPENNTHPMMLLKFSWAELIKDFESLDEYYTFFTPLVWPAGWLILPVILIIGFCLLRRDKIKAVSLIVFVIFVFLSLGVNKVNDSAKCLLLSSARMYLGIPLVTGIAFFWGRPLFSLSDKSLKISLLVMALSVFLIKTGMLKPVIIYNTLKTNYGSVALKKIKDLKCDCEKIRTVSEKNKVELIVFVPNWTVNTALMTFYDYGCPLLEKNMPQTVLIMFERRTWVFFEEKSKKRKTVMVYGFYKDPDQIRKIKGCEYISFNPDMLLFKNNDKRLDSLLKQIDLGYGR